jgi:hypothetical protein
MACGACKQFGGGLPLSYLNTMYKEPSASAGSNVLLSQAGLARPVLNATGGTRRKRNVKKTRRRNIRGGFYPSVMGGFVSNASRLVVPAGVVGYRMCSKATTKNKKKGSNKK